VNVRAERRGQKTGAKLIAAFRAHCRARGIGGLHAVTAANTRAAAFFMRCGMMHQAEINWRGRPLVFLGASLGRPELLDFRPVVPEDFDYCARLYFASMADIIRELNLDMGTQIASFRRSWQVAEIRIITLDATEIGWVQTRIENEALFLGQFFVDAAFQRQGIGTEIMHRLMGEAARDHRAMTLGVVKSNPAFRLYERLGFHVTREDDRKFYMRREPDGG
jgi:GNAT superfamily N-acetyltransferase